MNIKIIFIYFLIMTPALLISMTPKEIVDRADLALKGEKIYSRSSMTVYRSGVALPTQLIESYTMNKNSKSYSLSIYIEPKRMKGTANLMIDDDLWVRFSSTGRVRKLSSSAKKNSAGGSDFSYADMGDSGQGLSNKFRVNLIGMESIDGISCYKIELLANDNDAPYEKMIVYISKDKFWYLKIDYFENSANIKSLILYDYKTVNNLDYPFAYTMINHTKPSETRVIVEQFEIDSDKVKERFFTTGYLKSIR